jgi:hypothetical protein
VRYLSKKLFSVRNISLDLTGKSFFSESLKVKKVKTNSIDREIYPVDHTPKNRTVSLVNN